MTSAITLLLSSLLIIGILRTVRESRGESSAEQVTESPVQTEKISEVLPEPQAEIIVENPPYQAEEKKAVQKKPATAKKTPAKKAPAKKTTSKK
jgi:tRNA1(Val) A37 N6-methylase TrmN6